MTQATKTVGPSVRRLRWTPVFLVCMAFLLVFLVCVLGLLNDLENRRQLIYAGEIGELESHVERTVVRIEGDLRDGKTLNALSDLSKGSWLLEHWKRILDGHEDRLYAALSDETGRILASRENLNFKLNSPLKIETVSGYRDQVRRVWLQDQPQNLKSFEVSLPVTHNGKTVGFYCTAISENWLENIVIQSQRSRWLVWTSILLAISAILAITSISLYRLGQHTRDLAEALKESESRRLADLGRLIFGMAHELRNPLNAIRMNLFTSAKAIQGDPNTSKEETLLMLRESVSEIERVDELIGQLLGFARADDPQDTWIDMDIEIQAVIQFMKQIHETHGIQVDYVCNNDHVYGKISRKYFRQILLNLMQNARQAMRGGGRILLDLRSKGQSVELNVEDSGPGIKREMFDRIFEPFFSTQRDGVGLGLAVVKNLVEATGGNVSCQRSTELGGMRFSLQLMAKYPDPPSNS